MTSHFDKVAEAFSRKATIYDAFGDDHPNLARMRQKVYDHIGTVMPTGSKLLELNAGTGLDAVALVERGYRIHATDIAAGMVAEIEEKIATRNLTASLTSQQLSFTYLDQVTNAPFDGVISNSGGLNCIADITQVTRHLPQVLRPGGIVTWVIMPRFCPWEFAVILKDWRVGTRRWRRSGVVANVEGVEFRTTYFSQTAVRRAFDSQFRLIKLEGLSVVTPPADNKTFARNHPTLYRILVNLDDKLAHWPPFNGWGDFFIISMQYLGD